MLSYGHVIVKFLFFILTVYGQLVITDEPFRIGNAVGIVRKVKAHFKQKLNQSQRSARVIFVRMFPNTATANLALSMGLKLLIRENLQS